MPHLVRNERVKLLAATLNTGATASFGLGVLAPLVAALYGPDAMVVPPKTLVLGLSVWGGVAITQHLLARWVLGGLRE